MKLTLILFCFCYVFISRPSYAVTKKCETAVETVLNEKNPSRAVEVECQYYKVSELNEALLAKVKARLKDLSKPLNLDAKISSMMGDLKYIGVGKLHGYYPSTHKAGEKCITGECRPGVYCYSDAKTIELNRASYVKNGYDIENLYKIACRATTTNRLPNCQDNEYDNEHNIDAPISEAELKKNRNDNCWPIHDGSYDP